MVLVICPLIGLIKDQIKEGQPLGLTCASLQGVDDPFSDNPLTQLRFASSEEALANDFRNRKDPGGYSRKFWIGACREGS